MANKTLKRSQKLLQLSATERKEFLDSFDHVMVDCDGCIWSLLSPIEGAGEGLCALEVLGKRIIYVSNNSVRSVSNFRTQLQSVGLRFEESNLVNSVIAITHYLQQKQFKGLIYVIGSVEMRNRLKSEGFNVIYGVSIIQRIGIHFSLNSNSNHSSSFVA